MALISRPLAKKQSNNASMSIHDFSNPMFYEGDRLTHLLNALRVGIESARGEDGDSLPEKVWLKLKFAIGVNDVTRVLERMKPCAFTEAPQNPSGFHKNPKSPVIKLQAILLAGDCNPRMLAKHLPPLAASRKVPVLLIRDQKQGSLRLGELVKIKTAIAIGIKEGRSAINQTLEQVLQRSTTEQNFDHANARQG